MDITENQPQEKLSEKSYLSGAIESITPWGPSRSSTPKPASMARPGEGSGLKNQHGGYQSLHLSYGLSSKRYPSDCPPMAARWFYAVDYPKRKPKLLKNNSEESKPLPQPKKFVTFSIHDSNAIEAAYQKLADEHDDSNKEILHKDDDEGDVGERTAANVSKKANTSQSEAGQDENTGGKVRVPVHEDFLFDCDIEQRELAPVYWLGPIYEVRRGSWFYQEGSTLRPCDENLAFQLEEGYLKIKPFRYPKAQEKPSSKTNNDLKSLAISDTFGSRRRAGSGEVTPKASVENLKAASQQALEDPLESAKEAATPVPHQPQTYRLFGQYMNQVVTYQDATVAWLTADSIMSRVSSIAYQKFAGGGYLGGVKVVRGYIELGKTKESTASEKHPATPKTAALRPDNLPPTLQLDERQQKLLKRRSAPPSTKSTEMSEPEKRLPVQEPALSTLRREIDPEMEAEAVRKRDEKEIENDYNDSDGENQGREIEHLILVTHGIGQRLGMRTESVNFVHDVNVLRKTLKNVYTHSADLQALNSEIDKLPKNCRVQVLPVCWRHLLDFPKKGVRQNRKEHDLGEAFGDEEEYPSLEDITVEGVPFVRSLITDLALDILLYQSGYREHISTIVLEESNRIYKLFLQRNPYFKGKVSLIGHSLGSAVYFDILCRQRENTAIHGSNTHRQHYNSRPRTTSKVHGKDFSFDFDVEDFYCLGSPIGLFQMLKGRTIAGRHQPDSLPAESPMDPDYGDPYFASNAGYLAADGISTTTGLPVTISSPKCAELYNIFHPTDPISYRLEPLIAPAMSALKPQLLPYTKKSISASVSGIGATISQSVGGLWSSLSSGITNSLLNRSLGLSNDDVASMATPSSQTHSRSTSQSIGAGTNIVGGSVISDVPTLQRENTNEKQRQLAEETAAADRDGTGESRPTLIDDEIETLYAGFQKDRKKIQTESGGDYDWAEAEERGKKIRREEMKVRALNSNGRVDFSIQESVLDFNPMNTIASHLSYWADEDVSHFVMSQLLSRHRNFAKNVQK